MAEREIVKLTISKGFAKAVDELIEKGEYKSRADFFEKAGLLLLERHETKPRAVVAPSSDACPKAEVA